LLSVMQPKEERKVENHSLELILGLCFNFME
jgi:hypothetical protein